MDAFLNKNMLNSEMDKIIGGKTITYTIVNEDGSVTVITETI